MKGSIVVNDAPFGSEEAYDASRQAMALQKGDVITCEVRVFLLADAVAAAVPMQVTPQGYCNVERMREAVIAKGGSSSCAGRVARRAD